MICRTPVRGGPAEVARRLRVLALEVRVVERVHEVDRDVDALERPGERGGVHHVGADRLARAVVLLGTAGHRAHGVPVGDEGGDETATDEAGGPGDQDGAHGAQPCSGRKAGRYRLTGCQLGRPGERYVAPPPTCSPPCSTTSATRCATPATTLCQGRAAAGVRPGSVAPARAGRPGRGRRRPGGGRDGDVRVATGESPRARLSCPWRRRRRASSRAMAGVAVTPCSSTETMIGEGHRRPQPRLVGHVLVAGGVGQVEERPDAADAEERRRPSARPGRARPSRSLVARAAATARRTPASGRTTSTSARATTTPRQSRCSSRPRVIAMPSTSRTIRVISRSSRSTTPCIARW